MNLKDLAPELGKLFSFAAATAEAIGTHSAHNPEADLSKIESAVDVHWLSETLVNFDQFGSALANNNAAQLAAACQCHITAFQTLTTPTRHPYAPAATFKRSQRHFVGKNVQIGAMVEVLESLRIKALSQARHQRERRITTLEPPRRVLALQTRIG